MARRWSPDLLDRLTALNDADARSLLIGGPGGRSKKPSVPDERAAGRPQDLADLAALERGLTPSRK